VGEADDGLAGFKLIVELAPAVLLLNAEVEGLNGLQASRDVRRPSSSVAVVLMTTLLDEEQLFYAIKYGAAVYVPISIAIDELCRTSHGAANGDYLINDTVLAKPAVAARVLTSFGSFANDQEREAVSLYVPLSVREPEVLDYIARGNSNGSVRTQNTIEVSSASACGR
jgi:DNA-binding NarL/FixJ family response regulator